MGDYDTVLKMLLRHSQSSALREWLGTAVTIWHDVELPKVETRRADLLGETAEGTLIHIELQSRSDPDMPLRMAEYAIGIYRKFGKLPIQILLYVGRDAPRMPAELQGPGFFCRYRVIDLRKANSVPLLASEEVSDNILAILTRLDDNRGAVRQMVTRVARLEGSRREIALRQLTTLAGLRNLGSILNEEVATMPILESIMEHDLFGPVMRKGLQLGELKLLRIQIERRFGPIPEWAETRLLACSSPELEALSLRILDTDSLAGLFH